ncbi:thioredoxin family protein [Fulvivirgaceae bacterium BMA10]|uniref:Thioredoxin family protein n=1 Tax=Splendidivirga corallicola TaxID=3051826 RepID=A0ABT8KLI1_9BACT|nr:thioredoxin family protein [Fulvivirgaceae bacterium BMA10]
MKKIQLLSLFLVLGLFINASEVEDGYKIGDYVSDFSLKNIDGKLISMSDYKDAEGFIIIFTCNTCPYSKLYEQRITELHNNYASKGFPVIAINPNDAKRQPGDSFEKMKERAKAKKFPFPYVLDETQNVATEFGATRTPHVFLLDKENDKLKVAYIGAIDNNSRNPEAVTEKYVEKAIGEIKAGKSVSKTNSKAIGCTIKWREA